MRISDWSSDVCSSDLDTRLAPPFRDLALIRQTALEFDTLKPQEVVDRLKPLATEGNPWFGSAGEMVAIAYMKMRKPELSGPLFAAMSKDRSVPETIRTRAVQMAGLLGVDAEIGRASCRERVCQYV